MSEKVFNFLKREGECWHEMNINLDHGFTMVCKKCGHVDARIWGTINPDFTTPDGMMWILERLKEKGYTWRMEFDAGYFEGTDDEPYIYFEVNGYTMGNSLYREDADSVATLPEAVLNAAEKMVEETDG